MVKKTKNIEYYEAVGRRKKAIARVRLYMINKNNQQIQVNNFKIKKGEIFINSKSLENFIKEDYERELVKLPLKLTNNEERFAINILVKGGGIKGQKEAIIHGISRALLLVDENYKKILRENSLLTRDPRKKERRKVGTGGKARREKQSPKR